jgi:prophage regulatory protein
MKDRDIEIIETKEGQRTAPLILRVRDVIQRTGLSRSTIIRLEQNGKFPPHIDLSPRSIGWSSEDVDLWVREQVQSAHARRHGNAVAAQKRAEEAGHE